MDRSLSYASYALALCWSASAAMMVTSMTEEDTERTACAGHIVGSTPHVSLKLKRCHLSARAAGFKA